MQTRRAGPIDFAPDFSWGRWPSGEEITFTRSERLVLERLVQDAGRVVGRERLLDVLEEAGLESADRNVDFLINRLRRKLSDSARTPTFIRTQYGEGYAWIAAQTTAGADVANAFLAVGPVRGLPEQAGLAACAGDFCDELARRIQLSLVGGREVVVAYDYAPSRMTEGPQFHVEVTFAPGGRGLDAVVALYRDGVRVLHLSRYRVTDTDDRTLPQLRDAAQTVAQEVEGALWRSEAFVDSDLTPSDHSLPVRLHVATSPFATRETWVETRRRLRTVVSSSEDSQSRLLLALNIHSKYVKALTILPEQDFRAQDEDEMERLVLEALPGVQDNPSLVLMAAKLLYFLDRGYRSMALEIAEDAYARSTALASAYVAYGQFRMFEGDIPTALKCYERAMAIQAPEPMDFVKGYVEVLECTTYQAAGDWAGLARALDRLGRAQPEAVKRLSLLFRSPDGRLDTADFDRVLDSLDVATARGKLRWVTYVSGRLFVAPEHRRNVLGGVMSALVSRFGRDVVPQETRAVLRQAETV
ncbi:winged helix-turn-helix domain-containing protein [Tranquillimonas rosea]|uniref:winged helix-turn-helix domain-containing protein n=1 Tax=Tranquillimonas rosea TaxID=641238 RepID=UPI003BAD6BA4